MSNTLDPIDEDTAMSPKPRRATATEESRSGIDVPAAMKLRPITGSEMPAVLPTNVAIHTMSHDMNAIQRIHMMKVKK